MTLTHMADGTVCPPFPLDETGRLAQLESYRILDTAADPRFDRITRLTADLLDVPIVLVSLVDHAREWFKSTVGTEISQISRHHGFCAHALTAEGEAGMTVIDTLDDPRFSTHPFVIGDPKLRFYSGAPLIAASGQKIGMLCVHDVRPRPDFGEDKQRILAQLAAITMDEIDFHRIEAERLLLIGELSHRVKNVFANIQSVASVSGRGDAGAARFLDAFIHRLGAMSKAHDQIVAGSWQGAWLEGIVRSVISAFETIEESRFQIDMPAMTLEPVLAQTLALLLHELLTNAIKYGALREPQGRIFITATRARTGKASALLFVWRETGGPVTAPPTRQGFGHRMLVASVKHQGGNVDFNWLSSGLVCTFEFNDGQSGRAA